ncbi:hypothetical protein ABEB36_014181 [Hypothenemus hampei]|uniref:Retrotransposon gag domain-containing protein n=1 Tax=Hypothenemus hampei TaxID=57062 RepID=A0ABD1E3J1_HYPHA
MGKDDIDAFYEELITFKKKLTKDNKERCADIAVSRKKWILLQDLLKIYSEKVKPKASNSALQRLDEKVHNLIIDCTAILRNRLSSATSEEASFDPVAHSTATAFTQRRSPTRSTSHSSTSDENPFEITILPRPEDQYRNSSSEKTPLPRQRIQTQGTNIMATANTTIREALSQATDPATPKFVQPPIFRPASDSPSSFLLGYERAAIGNRWNDNYKILYLGQFLGGPAHKWYQRYLSNDANSTKNWETIKQDMKTEFLEGQQGFTSNHFYHKKQRYNEDIKHYYYELQGLADEVDLNMPFPEFLAQFEKGLHPKFRQLYYVLRDNDMHSGSLKVIIQKLHRSQESLSENNYSPTFDYTSSPRFNNNYFRNNQNYSRNNQYWGNSRGNNRPFNNNPNRWDGSRQNSLSTQPRISPSREHTNTFPNRDYSMQQQNALPNTRGRDGRPQCQDCRRYGHYSCNNTPSINPPRSRLHPNAPGQLQ